MAYEHGTALTATPKQLVSSAQYDQDGNDCHEPSIEQYLECPIAYHLCPVILSTQPFTDSSVSTTLLLVLHHTTLWVNGVVIAVPK